MSSTEPSKASLQASTLLLQRVALIVEYDGTRYRGLQRQAHDDATIQHQLEQAACTLGSHDVSFVASGRTDAGVHALGQVVAMNLPRRLEEKRIARALNALLPGDIRVRRAVICSTDFSPRFDARERTYIYRLSSHSIVTPLQRHFVAHTPYELNEEQTKDAAGCFKGHWEMKKWRSVQCQGKRTLLTIDEARAIPPQDSLPLDQEPCSYWRFLFRARSFLHHQVRFMVGGVIAVGSGRLSLEELKESLKLGTRPVQVKCEPACGLCFTAIGFLNEKDPFNSLNEKV
jgi:tRNA pseudouridine38-40 synthase